MALADKFTKNIRSLRLKKEMSQDALAAKAGVTVSYVSMLERGLRCPPLPTVEAIAKGLGVPPLSLLS